MTFGYRKRVQEIKEWISIAPSDYKIKGIGTCDVNLKVVGRMHKARHYFSYQVYKGQIIVTGGCLTSGETLKSTEVIDCNDVRGTPITTSIDKANFPHLNRKRHFHQSLILGGRYLYVFFGMSSETLLTCSIEYVDLQNKD